MSGVESTEIEKYFAQITAPDILSFTFLAIIEIISSAIVCDKYDVCPVPLLAYFAMWFFKKWIVLA